MADTTIKKCTLDVYVKDSRLEEVEQKFDRIRDLFNVELKYGSSQGKQYMVNPGKWLEVIGTRENAVKAREYVKGISNPEEIVRLRIPGSLLADKISAKVDDLEKETAAIISFKNNEDVVEITGWINGVTKAAMNIENTITVFVKEQNVTGTDLCQDTTHDGQTAGISIDSHNHSLNTSNEGVVFDNSIPASYFCNEIDLIDDTNGHDCVTNVEQNQYGTLTDFSKQGYCFCNNNDSHRKPCASCDVEIQKQGNCSYSPNTEPTLTADLMEFGLKLGYREDEVKSAMKKLGTETAVNQNELLHELIKASTSTKQIGKADECKVENSTGYPKPADSSILRHVVIDGSNVAMRYAIFLSICLLSCKFSCCMQ